MGNMPTKKSDDGLDKLDAFAQWEAMLTPEIVQDRLLRAGLFLIGYELLEDVIVLRLREFFVVAGLSSSNEDYGSEVLSLDPKGRNDAVRGSLKWLLKMGVIDPQEEQLYIKIKKARNAVAHELGHIIGGQMNEEFGAHFPHMLDLLTKVHRWWILEVDIVTDPVWDGVAVDPSQIMPDAPDTRSELSFATSGGNPELKRANLFRGSIGHSFNLFVANLGSEYQGMALPPGLVRMAIALRNPPISPVNRLR
jgi:hypothetical protein